MSVDGQSPHSAAHTPDVFGDTAHPQPHAADNADHDVGQRDDESDGGGDTTANGSGYILV